MGVHACLSLLVIFLVVFELGVQGQGLDECAAGVHNCHADATCTDTRDGYLCACNEGFEGDGVECTDLDECSSQPCHANAICTNTPGSFICACNDGFMGDGFNCTSIVPPPGCGSPPTFDCTSITCSASAQFEFCTYVCLPGCTGTPSIKTLTCEVEDGEWLGLPWGGCIEGCPPVNPLPTEFDYAAATSAITGSTLDPDVADEVGMDSFLSELSAYAEYDGTPLADLPNTPNITITPERWVLTYTDPETDVTTGLFLDETRNFDPDVGLPDELPSVALGAIRQRYPLYYQRYLSNLETNYRNSRATMEFNSATYGPDPDCPYPLRTDLGSGFALRRIAPTLCRPDDRIEVRDPVTSQPIKVVPGRDIAWQQWNEVSMDFRDEAWFDIDVTRCCSSAPPGHPPCVDVICGSQQPPYPNGYTCGYTCARNCTGFYSTFVTCRNGNWIGTPPECVPLLCREPAPEFSCTTRSGCAAPYTEGETCTYRCNDTCTGSPSIMTRTCIQGIWTGDPWRGCHKDCGDPPSYGCAIRTGCDPPYNNGETCHYECDRERGCTGSPATTAFECIDGTWVGSRWRGCWPRKCGNPPNRNWAVYTCDEAGPLYPSGTMCTYRCRRGCSAIPATAIATCHNGRWYGDRKWRCKKGCGAPPDPPCTERFGCAPFYTYGESCYYRCYNEGGYAMEVAGDPIRTCEKPGVWSGTDLVCECKDREECCRPDIIFVLDYSGSMSGDIPQVKDFVYELVNRFEIGDLDARVGILRYNHDPIVAPPPIQLNTYDNKGPLLAAISSLPVTVGGGTSTGEALTYVANTMLLPVNGNRAEAPDTVIVLTDGYATDSVTGPASVLHSMGVQTFAIGVGGCVSDAQLHDIANCDDHVYKLADFNGLRGITTMVHNQICCDKPRDVCRYHGCFNDYPVRKFPFSPLWNHPAMTGDLCWKHCQDQGYPYAATEYYRQCFCGTTQNFNNLDPQLPDSQCNTPCSGNPNEMCGGVWRMSVYSSSVTCPENYERVMANGPCLRFSTDRQTYQQARETCRDEGARLVVIKSAAFDAFIDNRIQNTYNAETWIGLDDINLPFSQYVWSDGSVLDTAAGDFDDWSPPGQPDTIYGERCVEIRPQFNYQWNNHHCWLLKNYICEIVATPPCCPRPRTYVSDPGYTVSDDQTYRLSPPVQCQAPAEELPDV